MIKNVLKKSLPYLAQFLFLLILFSVGSNYFLEYSPNPLYRALKIVEPHHTFGWMQKNLLDTRFEGALVLTDQSGFRISEHKVKEKNLPSLLTLGPSSAFGWGIEANETYGHQVATSLGLDHINASGIGHSIFQGERVLNYLISSDFEFKKLKYVIISYGVNDLDKFRFFDSYSTRDEDFFNRSNMPFFDKFAYRFSLTTILHLAYRKFQYTSGCDHLMKIESRVPFDEFEKRFLNIVHFFNQKNIKVILVNTPFFLKDINKNFSKEKIESDYHKVQALAQKNRCREAHDWLKKAKELEPDNIRFEVNQFNKRLEKLASSNLFILIDAHQTLEENPLNFYDPVHPSKIGHLKISQIILDAISKIKK